MAQFCAFHEPIPSAETDLKYRNSDELVRESPRPNSDARFGAIRAQRCGRVAIQSLGPLARLVALVRGRKGVHRVVATFDPFLPFDANASRRRCASTTGTPNGQIDVLVRLAPITWRGKHN